MELFKVNPLLRHLDTSDGVHPVWWAKALKSSLCKVPRVHEGSDAGPCLFVSH